MTQFRNYFHSLATIDSVNINVIFLILFIQISFNFNDSLSSSNYLRRGFVEITEKPKKSPSTKTNKQIRAKKRRDLVKVNVLNVDHLRCLIPGAGYIRLRSAATLS